MGRGGSDNKDGGCLGRLGRAALAICAAGLIVGASVGALLYMDYRQFRADNVLEQGETKRLVIPEETNWPEVVDRVERAGLVERGIYFDVWGRRTRLPRQVKAGSFFLEGPMSLEELADVLRRGGFADEIEVTFQEGLTIFDMADRVEEAGLVDREAFLEAARNTGRYDWTIDRMESLEGYLYPETYRFYADVSAAAVVDELVEHWMEHVEPLFETHEEAFAELRRQYDFDRHDVITMASLIEMETSVDSERPVVARVFYNRLDRGMRLQTDPTCVYGESTYDQTPTPQLCNDPMNRYSTYVNDGLPPGPIANPTPASVEAALLPSEDSEASGYLYFVSRADGSGEHYFSTSYAEHRRAVQRFLID